MRTALRTLTGRGRGVAVAGVVTTLAAVLLGQRDLLRVGVLLVALPLLSAALVARTRYRLASARGLRPARVAVDQPAFCVVRLENVSRLPSGLLLVEDDLPWQLGRPQRFVVDRLEGGARRDVRYELRSPLRGRHTVGPLTVRLVDPFGMCRMTRRFTTTDLLTIVPRVVPLPAVPLGGDWSGLGEARARAVASSGEDDVVPREYRTGDELRRVHWKATARASELMVRREEQPWRTRATVLLDTREAGHRGDGPSSSFEWSVTATASIACHLARRGYSVRLLDIHGSPISAGPIPTESLTGSHAEGPILDALALVDMDEEDAPGILDPTLRAGARDGLVVAVLGDLDAEHAQPVAQIRHGRTTALALLADTSAWPGPRATAVDAARVAGTARLLAGAGWRVQVCGPGADLATSWRGLAHGRSSSFAVPAPTTAEA